MVPDLEARYWDFDNGLLGRLYGVPRWFVPRGTYESVDVLTSAVERWVVAGLEEYGGGKEVPLDVEWEEYIGPRITRERRVMYRCQMGLSTRSMAGMDLGFLLG